MKTLLEENTVVSENNTAAWLLHLSISLKMLIPLHLFSFELDFAYKVFWQWLSVLHSSPGTYWLLMFSETQLLFQ